MANIKNYCRLKLKFMHWQFHKLLNLYLIFSIAASGNYWVLGALLIILTASCLPSAIASPRRMVGRHLILPHRHHVHLRSAGQEHHPPPNRFMNCMVGMNVTEASTAHAIIVSEETRNATIDLLESWVSTLIRCRVRSTVRWLVLQSVRSLPGTAAVERLQLNGRSQAAI